MMSKARQFHLQELFEWNFSMVVRCNQSIVIVSELQVDWGKLRRSYEGRNLQDVFL